MFNVKCSWTFYNVKLWDKNSQLTTHFKFFFLAIMTFYISKFWVCISFYLQFWEKIKKLWDKTKQILEVLRSGFLRLIKITDHRKQYLPIWSPISIFLMPSFYHVEFFIVMIQSRFLLTFIQGLNLILKMNSHPLVREDFLFEGWKRAFLWTFKKNIYIFISHKSLNMHCILFWQSFNFCTIACTRPDFMSCMWDGPFTPDSHILRLQCVCSPCVQCPCVQCRSTECTVKNPTFTKFY